MVATQSIARNPQNRAGDFHNTAAHAPRRLANLPAELIALRQWVCWRKETRNGKPTKVPYSPRNGRPAATDDPRTWAGFDQAAAAFQRSYYDGIGFVFTDHDPYCGIDFDHCVDGDGNLLPAVAARVAALDSYTEWSQSGKGIHVIVRAELPDGKGRRTAKHGIEVYDRLRYFCMTGNLLPGAPPSIEARQAELDRLLAAAFPPATPTVRPLKHPPGVTSIPAPTRPAALQVADGAVLEQLCASPAAWHLFFNGRGRGSASELDWRLACFLFEAGATFDQADQLFRRSALMRSKWDEVHGQMTYGGMTLAKAWGHIEAQRAQGGE